MLPLAATAWLRKRINLKFIIDEIEQQYFERCEVILFYSCCIGYSSLNTLEILHNHGYQGYETGFPALTATPDEKIAALAEKARELDMTCVSYNGMFPGEIPLLDGKDGYSKVSEYLDTTFEKAKPLGSPTIVLGCGKAREIPESMSLEEAKERFKALLTDVIAPFARRNGIVIAIEELRAEECNFINNCCEAMEIIRDVNLPEIQLLVDYYHSILGGDKLTDIIGFGKAIRHVHFASPKNKRHFPNIDDIDDCRNFISALRAAGYDGAISFEGNYGENFTSAIAEAITVMKEAEKSI